MQQKPSKVVPDNAVEQRANTPPVTHPSEMYNNTDMSVPAGKGKRKKLQQFVKQLNSEVELGAKQSIQTDMEPKKDELMN